SGVISPRSYRSSVCTNSSISASLANVRRARPAVWGSSTAAITLLLSVEAIDRGFTRDPRRPEPRAPRIERCHVANHHRTGSVVIAVDMAGFERPERAAPDALARLRRVLDDRRRRLRVPAALDQPRGQRRATREAHHDD